MTKAEYEIFEALNPFFRVVMEGLCFHPARRFPGNYFGPHDHDSRFRA
jgi:hypothetical protein